ncbi:MAG TPA: C4-dicarboxylic acid transporter DauA [Polyangiaceae bacterium]|jgi:SulP family sulfate permease|nr:C4-dicarboxylic acid transporter DauA [Polyangiaceae bacterium]
MDGTLTPPAWRPVPIASAMRRVLARGYTARDFLADVTSGVLVGIVALPLSMALAIAVGVPPQHGLYTAIVAGAVVALLGGCKFQVTGPTAAFVVILSPIASRFGLSGLLTAGMLAGVFLIAMGLLRLGALIRFIPYPVTTGFTAGIATVIATLQLKDVFGLDAGKLPDHFVERASALFRARGTARWEELAVAAGTMALLVGLPRITKRIPAPLVAMTLVAGIVVLVHRVVPAFTVATIGSRFHTTIHGVVVNGIPRVLPLPSLPWGSGGLSFADLRELLSASVAIAILGAIESLLSATIADGMTQTRHDPDAELVALGIGNVVAPFFGGIPATGALARTATNIRSGARSPISAVVHSAVVLLCIVVAAPLVAYVPMASLAALLLLVAWNMSEAHHFAGIVRVAPKSDVAVLVVCYLLTVVFDMVVAVSVGVILAAFLFIRRMSELTRSAFDVTGVGDDGEPRPLPDGVVLYEIEGPLFFGAAQTAMRGLQGGVADRYKILVLNLSRVSVMDATGLAALENAIADVVRRKKRVVLVVPLGPKDVLERARLDLEYDGLLFAPDLDAGIVLAGELVAKATPSVPVLPTQVAH